MLYIIQQLANSNLEDIALKNDSWLYDYRSMHSRLKKYNIYIYHLDTHEFLIKLHWMFW